eukprot:Gb_27800 [translate_table: standard]
MVPMRSRHGMMEVTSLSPPPHHLVCLLLIVMVFLMFSWYMAYDSVMESIMDQLSIAVMGRELALGCGVSAGVLDGYDILSVNFSGPVVSDMEKKLKCFLSFYSLYILQAPPAHNWMCTLLYDTINCPLQIGFCPGFHQSAMGFPKDRRDDIALNVLNMQSNASVNQLPTIQALMFFYFFTVLHPSG